MQLHADLCNLTNKFSLLETLKPDNFTKVLVSTCQLCLYSFTVYLHTDPDTAETGYISKVKGHGVIVTEATLNLRCTLL